MLARGLRSPADEETPRPRLFLAQENALSTLTLNCPAMRRRSADGRTTFVYDASFAEPTASAAYGGIPEDLPDDRPGHYLPDADTRDQLAENRRLTNGLSQQGAELGRAEHDDEQAQEGRQVEVGHGGILRLRVAAPALSPTRPRGWEFHPSRARRAQGDCQR